ncbi:MAG: glycosyltransferase [Candidatus Omnitrophota bacterium]
MKMLKNENIIYFGNDWNADNRTSSHHIALQLSRDNRVLYIEASGLRPPKMSGHDITRVYKKMLKVFSEPKKVSDSIYVYSPLILPFHGNALLKIINKRLLGFLIKRVAKKLGFKNSILWIIAPHMAMAVDALNNNRMIYYCVDDFSSMPGVKHDLVSDYDAFLTASANAVFTPSIPLYEKKLKANKNTFLSPHGVDIRHFSTEVNNKTQAPDDIKDLKHPVIGFFGLIEKWVDLELIKEVATKKPDWSILMIGRVAQDISGLAGLKNIIFLGAKPYSVIPDYGKSFDVAIMPYVLNDQVYNANPIKLREYLCMGKPVVSVRTPEVEKFSDVVEIADGYADFIKKIEKCLVCDNEAKIKERIAKVAKLSWENRCAEISTIACDILKGERAK